MRVATCQECGGDFETPGRKGPPQKNCDACIARKRRGRLVSECRGCGKAFIPPDKVGRPSAWCSDACKRARPERMILITCEWCEHEFEYQSARRRGHQPRTCSRECRHQLWERKRYGGARVWCPRCKRKELILESHNDGCCLSCGYTPQRGTVNGPYWLVSALGRSGKGAYQHSLATVLPGLVSKT